MRQRNILTPTIDAFANALARLKLASQKPALKTISFMSVEGEYSCLRQRYSSEAVARAPRLGVAISQRGINIFHCRSNKKDHFHASRIQHAQNGGQRIDRSGLHPFASQRARAVSDLCRIEVLAKEMLSQRSRATDCSSHDPICKLIDVVKKANGLYGDDNRLYFIDPLIRLKKPALEVIEHLTGATLACGCER